MTTAEIAKVSARMKSSSENSVQAAKVSDAGRQREDHQVLRRPVGEPLAGRLRVLRPLDQLDDLASAVSAPTLVARKVSVPDWLIDAADDLVARRPSRPAATRR